MMMIAREIIHQEHEGLHLKSLRSPELSQSLYDFGVAFGSSTPVMHDLMLSSDLEPWVFKTLNH